MAAAKTATAISERDRRAIKTDNGMKLTRERTEGVNGHQFQERKQQHPWRLLRMHGEETHEPIRRQGNWGIL